MKKQNRLKPVSDFRTALGAVLTAAQYNREEVERILPAIESIAERAATEKARNWFPLVNIKSLFLDFGEEEKFESQVSQLIANMVIEVRGEGLLREVRLLSPANWKI